MTWITAGIDALLREQFHLDAERTSPDWRPWEYKTWQLHRGVLHGRLTGDVADTQQVMEQIRDRVRQAYRVAWWRGFAFGAVVELPRLPAEAGDVARAVHTVDRWVGTCQWVVLAATEERIVVGVHTWMEIALSGLYRETLGHFRRQWYEVIHHTRAKGRLLTALHAIAGLRGVRFPPFREP